MKKFVILGSGPNRIGQGIEFDYCCAGVPGIARAGLPVDHDQLQSGNGFNGLRHLRPALFEPLTGGRFRSLGAGKPAGVIVQFGGQTPLNLAAGLQRAGINIIGTKPRAIDIAEDRRLFGALLKRLRLPALKMELRVARPRRSRWRAA